MSGPDAVLPFDGEAGTYNEIQFVSLRGSRGAA